MDDVIAKLLGGNKPACFEIEALLAEAESNLFGDNQQVLAYMIILLCNPSDIHYADRETMARRVWKHGGSCRKWIEARFPHYLRTIRCEPVKVV